MLSSLGMQDINILDLETVIGGADETPSPNGEFVAFCKSLDQRAKRARAQRYLSDAKVWNEAAGECWGRLPYTPRPTDPNAD